MSLDVSIIAEQGLPYDLVHSARDQITSVIERALGQDVALSVKNGTLSMSPEGGVHWSDSVAQTSGASGIVLFVTELPLGVNLILN